MFFAKPFVNPEEDEEISDTYSSSQILESEGSKGNYYIDPKKAESEQQRINYENTIKELNYRIESANIISDDVLKE